MAMKIGFGGCRCDLKPNFIATRQSFFYPKVSPRKTKWRRLSSLRVAGRLESLPHPFIIETAFKTTNEHK